MDDISIRIKAIEAAVAIWSANVHGVDSAATVIDMAAKIERYITLGETIQTDNK